MSAKTPGMRKVTGETSEPMWMRLVSRARPARVDQASVVGSPAGPGKLAKWSERKKASSPASSAVRASARISA